jgi:hypothetical protein
MKEFPHQLRPENINHFSEYKEKRILGYLRTYIVEEMWKTPTNQNDEKSNISKSWEINLTNMNLGGFNIGWKIDKRLVDIVAGELNELGWKTSMGYGDTMLFITVPGNSSQNIACKAFE